MNIAALQTGFGTEVPDRISCNIYVAGCQNNKACERSKCQNKHLHSFSAGRNAITWYEEIRGLIRKECISAVCILGGEPFDQEPHSMIHLVRHILVTRNLPVYVYTGYEQQNIPGWAVKIPWAGIFAGPYVEGRPELQGWIEMELLQVS